MSEREEPGSLEDLDARLRKLKAQERRPDAATDNASRSGFGLAMRIGVEIVAALIVGAGIGLLLDRWLGTGPWLLVLFFVLGAAAGVLNVYRVMTDMGGAVGYRPADRAAARKPAADDDED